ncbi:MAG: erythromycin esterase family protein [Pedobacter sp.]|nr:MAG: erythromycin esterase family protein [Pedobacter sp.]
MMKINILLIILVFLTFKSAAQDPLISALEEKVIEIGPVSAINKFENFKEFGELLADNKILALGEETHGIKEFGAFRATLIKHLVSELNYKSIVLEADFSGMVDLNDYIVYGRGQLYQALLKKGTRVFSTQEYLELFEWLKTYNQMQPVSERVRIYGGDGQSTMIAIDLRTKSVKPSNALSPNAVQGLKLLSIGLGQPLTKKQKDTVMMLAGEIRDEMALFPDTSIYRQSLNTLLQSIDLVTAEFTGYRRSFIRDKALADNITWIYERDKRKTILLAHNAHIAKNPIFSDVKRAGFFLKQTYGKQYYTLGFSFFTGQFLANDDKSREDKVFDMPEIKNKKSSEYIFSQIKIPNFILDFASASKNPIIDDFLKQKTYSKNIGMGFRESSPDRMPGFMPLIDKFDGIAFFRVTSATSFIRIYDRIKSQTQN